MPTLNQHIVLAVNAIYTLCMLLSISILGGGVNYIPNFHYTRQLPTISVVAFVCITNTLP